MVDAGSVTKAAVKKLSQGLIDASTKEIVTTALSVFSERICVVSSFGADAGILLHIVSSVDARIPIIFIDTGLHFAETLAYRDTLIDHFQLTNVTSVVPSLATIETTDPESLLWASDTSTCCRLRKSEPLVHALRRYDAWISGQKRFQTLDRAAIDVFEFREGRAKINPLASWSHVDLRSYEKMHCLPTHPLVSKNYMSIGCIPCTTPVRPGEGYRAGRWRGKSKVECGIHTS